jgi:hypothetical protein
MFTKRPLMQVGVFVSGLDSPCTGIFLSPAALRCFFPVDNLLVGIQSSRVDDAQDLR